MCCTGCVHHHVPSQEPGKLKLVPECIAFKSSKSGQVQQFGTSDIKSLGWMRVARGYELKVFLQDGKIVKFDGFKEAVKEKAQHCCRAWVGARGGCTLGRCAVLFVCRTTTTLWTLPKGITGRMFQRQRSV